jgi:hypothetical protein
MSVIKPYKTKSHTGVYATEISFFCSFNGKTPYPLYALIYADRDTVYCLRFHSSTTSPNVFGISLRIHAMKSRLNRKSSPQCSVMKRRTFCVFLYSLSTIVAGVSDALCQSVFIGPAPEKANKGKAVNLKSAAFYFPYHRSILTSALNSSVKQQIKVFSQNADNFPESSFLLH